MKKTLIVLNVILAIIILATIAYATAVGSCVTKHERTSDGQDLITMTWISSTGGIVSGTGSTNQPLTGYISQVDFVPGTSSYAPDDNYDVQILDSSGIDVLMGYGMDLSCTANKSNQRVPWSDYGSRRYLYNETLTPYITNAGSANRGVIRIYIGG